ncbi:PAS domain-containing sensor histidine kinase [Sneathiella litorea]|uniref:histidine kinase n=1 Tax=Sneathiella litorea TaxID=2606216 RepID=A0A6L8W7G0_9PROT|nr:PAS domain-containing sensor histidine kinase [Sneathiella litorea]MZR31016.1 PAS domain S-box protein [Sneathiella litorea]
MKQDTQLDFAPNLFKRIIHDSLNEVFLFDGETLKFLFVNRGALQNLGYSFDELQHLTPIDIKPEYSLSQFNELIQPLKDGAEEKLTFQTKHKRKDTSTYDVEVHLQYYAEKGKSYFFAIILDVTAANETAAKLEQALAEATSSIQVKDNFLASMSHELRTPLNAIIGFSQMMHDSVFGDLQNQRYKDYIVNILSSAEHLLEMVDDILLARKLEIDGIKLTGEVYDPVAHTAEIVESFADTASREGKRVVLIQDSTAPKRIFADRGVGKVIQSSMISDALRHAGENGTVSIRWYSVNQEVLKCRIEDDGDTYPESMLKSFDMHFLARDAFVASERHKSFGLGIYICKRYVEARGGDLIVGNRENGGTFVEASWAAASLQAEF